MSDKAKAKMSLKNNATFAGEENKKLLRKRGGKMSRIYRLSLYFFIIFSVVILSVFVLLVALIVD